MLKSSTNGHPHTRSRDPMIALVLGIALFGGGCNVIAFVVWAVFS